MSTKIAEKTNEWSFLLAPSSVAGVGVFATHGIRKDTELRLFSNDDSRFIPYYSPLLESPIAKNFCDFYCLEDDEGYFCPQNFRKMEIGWYLNHSKNPNVYHRDYIFFALKDVKQGEEILIDYETLSSKPLMLKPIKLK